MNDLADLKWYDRNPRSDVMPSLPKAASRVLEVGCAGGAFGHAMKQQFRAEVWGLEYNAETAARAARVLDKVLVGDATELILTVPDNYFDLVTCNDVLEHLLDPWTFLRRLKAKLAPAATVVASIPNIRYYPALRTILRDRDFPALDDGIFDRTHLRFFTKKSIERLFAETGYRLARIEGINPTFNRHFRVLNAL